VGRARAALPTADALDPGQAVGVVRARRRRVAALALLDVQSALGRYIAHKMVEEIRAEG